MSPHRDQQFDTKAYYWAFPVMMVDKAYVFTYYIKKEEP